MGGTPARSRRGGTRARSRQGVPQPGQDGGYPGQGWGTPLRPGVGYPPRIGQQMEYLIRSRLYASCIHVGGLSCNTLYWDEKLPRNCATDYTPMGTLFQLSKEGKLLKSLILKPLGSRKRRNLFPNRSFV